MKILIRFILFFSFFVSLAVFNLQSVSWGLQLSWFLSIIFLIIFTLILIKRNKIIVTKKLKYFSLFIIYFIISTITSLIMLKFSIIDISKDVSSSDLINRSITHSIYLIFNFLVSIYIYIYFQHKQSIQDIVKYFIFYPSLVIMLIGIYVFLATYSLVPVDSILHNNLSLGYTFDRFKGDHRTASVFAEPSHYATYIAFLLPIYYAYFKKKIKIVSYSYRLPLFILYVAQIIMIKSMSFYLVLPIILIISYYTVNEKRINLKNFFYILSATTLAVVIIATFMFSRINEMIIGQDGSFIIRFNTFLNSIDLFLSSPIIGVGYGAIRGIDSFSTLLATIGILGFITFIFFLKKIHKDLNRFQKLIYVGFICMFITTLPADGMMDYLYFWIIISIILVNFKPKGLK